MIELRFISAAIIDYLFEMPASLATAYFFFDGRDSQKDLQLHDKLIRSLIWQFCLKLQNAMPEVLVNLYTRCGNGYQMPSTSSLQDTLQKILDAFSSVYIVLDALDECTEREKVLNWAKSFISQKNKNLGLHLIITSWPEKEIDDKFKGYPYVNLVEESGGCDIVAYLDHQLDQDSDLQEWDLETQEKIKSTLMKQADGMYVFCYYLKNKIQC